MDGLDAFNIWKVKQAKKNNECIHQYKWAIEQDGRHRCECELCGESFILEEGIRIRNEDGLEVWISGFNKDSVFGIKTSYRV